MSRLQEQAARDAARISDLDNMLSSAESDGNTQLITAHKKISELENMLRERESASTSELKEVNDTVTELKIELSKAKQLSSEQLEMANKKLKDLQVSYDQVRVVCLLAENKFSLYDRDIINLYMLSWSLAFFIILN